MPNPPTVSKDHQALVGIKQLLFARKLSPGQKIIYSDLAKQLGMSKTPIINALNKLENEGLVIYHVNRGYFVRQLTIEEVVQMYDLRDKLEAIAIDYAVSNGDEEGLAQLEQAHQDYLDYANIVYDGKRFQLDIGFHLAIAKMGKNDFLTDMLVNFYETAWVGLQVAYLTPQIPGFRDFHQDLYDAIKAKDARKAKKIAKEHWQTALNCILQGYEEP
ncbi:MAG: GntR family transcriptional regulator [Desulfarculaceae bacterium]|nr:GntR family transcriptional regulator [Desulfarculaceae bacterium]